MPEARFTVITLGVAQVGAAAAFYERLGFARRLRATGEEVAFFETGASVIALYPWDKLAAEAGLAEAPRPAAFRGIVLAWNCNSRADVDAALAQAAAAGARVIKPAQATEYGGYAGYFCDPDGHVWEAVTAPGLTVAPDGRLDVPE
ncbi:VOC family protein [Xanthobacteraceae bacterium Astr-EGSB]|uniref:VOC family protein n=1 Tax=Astrobacterium formosum TaxID=3069710 RepID=UPI0027B546C3|nr:VOC family protein [Xanthobacteraceae bacterium Astr-EGSB]